MSKSRKHQKWYDSHEEQTNPRKQQEFEERRRKSHLKKVQRQRDLEYRENE